MKCVYNQECQFYNGDSDVCHSEAFYRWNMCDNFRAKVIVNGDMRTCTDSALFEIVKSRVERAYEAMECEA